MATNQPSSPCASERRGRRGEALPIMRRAYPVTDEPATHRLLHLRSRSDRRPVPGRRALRALITAVGIMAMSAFVWSLPASEVPAARVTAGRAAEAELGDFGRHVEDESEMVATAIGLTTASPAGTDVPLQPPSPPATSSPPPPSSPADRGMAALRLIDYPWQQFGYRMQFRGPRAGILGTTNCATREIDVFVRETQSTNQIAFVTAFEIAHAVDCSTMTVQRREEWAALRGFPSGWRWFPPCACTEDDYGSGDFAMVFASWLVPDGGYRWRSTLAPPPDSIDRLLPFLRPDAPGGT